MRQDAYFYPTIQHYWSLATENKQEKKIEGSQTGKELEKRVRKWHYSTYRKPPKEATSKPISWINDLNINQFIRLLEESIQ